MRDRAAGRDGRRDGRGGGRGLLPRVQRALGDAVRPGQLGAGAAGQLLGHRQRLLVPARAVHARRVRGDGRPALHARVRRHQRGPRPCGRGGPQACRRQPGGVLLRQAHHAGRSPELPLHRGAAAPAGLLPGIGRRSGDRGDHAGAGPGSAAHAGLDRGRGVGLRAGSVHHDLVLPPRARGTARDGHRGQPAVEPVRVASRGHGYGGPVRPLHAVRPHAARGTGLLWPR